MVLLNIFTSTHVYGPVHVCVEGPCDQFMEKEKNWVDYFDILIESILKLKLLQSVNRQDRLPLVSTLDLERKLDLGKNT